MGSKNYILALDQGTTSSRAVAFDLNGNVAGQAQEEFTQHYPADGWVEHVPGDIWQSTLRTARGALQAAESDGGEVACIGITNQRETVVIWDRSTGKPIYNAIVW